MDGISIAVRTLPQALSPRSGAAPASQSTVPSDTWEDAPAFTPAEKLADKPIEKPVETPADKPVDKPVETSAGSPAEKPAEKPADSAASKPTNGDIATKATKDQTAATDQVVTVAAAAGTLLIAQAGQAQPSVVPAVPAVPVATPSSAPAQAASAGAGAAAIQAGAGQGGKAGQATASDSSAPAAAPTGKSAASAGAAPQTQTQTQVQSQASTASQPGNEDASAAKPDALKSLLDGAKPQGPSQPAAPTAPQATNQPATPSAAPQLAQVATPQLDAKPPATDTKYADAPAPVHAATDAPTAPAISFGTDPGATAQVKTATAAYEAARAAMPIVPASEQVAMEIHRAIEDGIDKLKVELKPASLGRVTAEIQFQSDHRVHVVLSADRSSTLDALRSDSRALERALQDAGLQADAGSLSFRFQNGGGQSGFQPSETQPDYSAPRAASIADTISNIAPYAAMMRPGGVDIRV